ncbi:site-specific DNA-methyltransferase [Acidiferrimicrobium sp. IK]|uniref:DNA-methyltransferase n=1 Tax=Acidiferrimicrobium sp. IK TaxID=2871700 RepID=UPI0021CAEA43|nr:site-specific DNA-methyltransferase [Acidiferrimicrobium sp. IK]MCU4186590.1 site-specific DNA-methyltransferase [Acidiferrimicrobium sp. IK]
MSAPEPLARPGRRRTATSAFGVGRRESHDASGFYRRFAAPTISDDATVCHPDDRPAVDRIFLGDIRDQPGTVAPDSVALVVTSPPYYSGKDYETAIGEGHVPASYTDYLAMLSGVFAECATALEPGGRMAINVANLGRKPYRSLSADVISILEDDLGLLLRGEVIWQKAKGAGGNCAWGTYQRPGDPVLRDLTERVIIASKGRFDRAVSPAERAARGLPSEGTIFRDEFLEATVDLWEIPPQSATRVGHPAPFPVELPQRLIDLYTYRDDLVVDPFMGSGTTAVAALRTGRHFVGYDTDAAYVAAALGRVEAERRSLSTPGPLGRPSLPPGPTPRAPVEGESLTQRGVREGRRARELARWALEDAGFSINGDNVRLKAGVVVHFTATDAAGGEWLIDVPGGFTATGGGLTRAETLFRTLGKAAVVQHTRPGSRYLLLSAEVPAPGSTGGQALRAVTGTDPATKPVYDVIALTAPGDLERLRSLGRADPPAAPGANPPPGATATTPAGARTPAAAKRVPAGGAVAPARSGRRRADGG